MSNLEESERVIKKVDKLNRFKSPNWSSKLFIFSQELFNLSSSKLILGSTDIIVQWLLYLKGRGNWRKICVITIFLQCSRPRKSHCSHHPPTEAFSFCAFVTPEKHFPNRENSMWRDGKGENLKLLYWYLCSNSRCTNRM